jgi:hypothetical protein
LQENEKIFDSNERSYEIPRKSTHDTAYSYKAHNNKADADATYESVGGPDNHVDKRTNNTKRQTELNTEAPPPLPPPLPCKIY